ncbi:MAG TPA: acyl-CoA dehydrogenase family protein [Anaeromyxobacteraceae bacterium]|nr:acyl-CoA dehydrogenase family protein [Anaeromyxobacteraceae bacterium]
MSADTSPAALPPGGGFLLDPAGSRRIETPSDFTAEQGEFFRAAQKFAVERVLASADAIERKDFPVVRRLLREAGELGFLSLDLPEAHGGLAQDMTTSVLVAEAMTVVGAWSVIFGAQVGIGTLPVVYFGTEEQQARYLPRLGSGEFAAAYALSEPSSASDALAARTRAALSPDGKHWILNGTKQWISNAGFADVFVVFAKVDGDKFSAFLVERATPGFTVGPEEHKMGIRGSSTCPLIFEDARIPAGNLLGEVGKGHRIAFNILNIGRLKLGATCIASCRNVVAMAAPYARERKAFGKSISDFGLIRDKLARMVSLIYVGESMSYRTTGLIDRRAAAGGAARGTPDFDRDLIAAVEEYNVEASILKVWGSEALWQVADEGVQIHGGYGFVEEYPIERTYRDNRVNRIFEGTNEINRLLVPGTLLKRAAKGQYPLQALAKRAVQAVAGGDLPPPPTGRLGRERRVAELNKLLFAYAAGVAGEALGPALGDSQEVLGALADVAIEAYAVDSAVARALQEKPDAVADACVKLYAEEAHTRAWTRARAALLGAVRDPAVARTHLARLRKLLDDEPGDVVAWREVVVAPTLERGRYPLSWA